MKTLKTGSAITGIPIDHPRYVRRVMDTATVVVPAELHAELDSLSREIGRSEDELVTEALRAYVLRYRRSRFSSLGAAESDSVTGENSEDWLLAHWNPD